MEEDFEDRELTWDEKIQALAQEEEDLREQSGCEARSVIASLPFHLMSFDVVLILVGMGCCRRIVRCRA